MLGNLNKFYYLFKFTSIFFTNFPNNSQFFLNNEETAASLSLLKAVLNIIFDLLTVNFKAISQTNRSFSLNVSNILPW